MKTNFKKELELFTELNRITQARKARRKSRAEYNKLMKKLRKGGNQ